ncbi:pentatricopeptide repeat-containing protein At4g21065-like [Phragmites australis]|uniref:pentatricopeptide repeat-containing protein At4g21065-like n=1 Tax=Phragmites australis TaxID=29695 RepID=UPI002D77B774|nr:pentatricopeptide repeat-containing protein At4g21065-like [Phragmites australis]XP_062224017.1 pentatricopeptide repeat-containing protein At4g21065-like [Phragmites australis]XP_062224018.1 pentatricopeptide repeat-containing protein At4g21065-like [Phragmites australis]XP_062224019.1 pentatricopeptide repeat-containing protein At4g21065-like [Phragmites australis]
MAPPPSPPLPAWAAANALFRRHRRLLPLLLPSASLRALLPVLSHCLVSGLARNPFVASRLLLSSSGLSLPFALLLLSSLPASSLLPFSFNSLIRASPPRLSLRLFDQMRRRGVPPDPYTLPFLIHACSGSDRLLCQSLHGQALRLGYGSQLFTQTALASMYFACGSVIAARRVFDEMPARDVVAWTGMMSGYVDSGMYYKAVEVFQEMRGAEDLVWPNVATMVSVASACAGLGSMEYAKGLHAYMEKVGWERELIVRNALIHMYGKCGGIESARGLFGLMCEKDLNSWTAMIAGLASHGHGKEAVALFFSMREEGVLPDSTTFIVVLSACSHAGLVDEGINIFNSMETEYNVSPDIKHYGCMVDLFSRAGLISRAYEFINIMPLEPNLAILGSLLSACSIDNELKIGELVLNKIESVCSNKGGAGVLLSNIYANQNLWHEVDAIRRKIRSDAIARKPPGQSLIATDVTSL